MSTDIQVETTTIEYGVKLTWDADEIDFRREPDLAAAKSTVAAYSDPDVFPGTAVLVTRRVITTVWEVAG